MRTREERRLISAKLTKLRFETVCSLLAVFTPNLCNLWRNGSLLNIFPEKCLSGRTGRAEERSARLMKARSKMVDAKRAGGGVFNLLVTGFRNYPGGGSVENARRIIIRSPLPP